MHGSVARALLIVRCAMVAVAVAVCGFAVEPPAEARPHHRGKVVRVERPRTSGSSLLACTPSETRGTAVCFGRSPRADEYGVALMSGSGIVGTIRIDRVEPSLRAGCRTAAIFEVRYAQLAGADVDPTTGTTALVFGARLDPLRAALTDAPYSLTSPSGRDDDTPWVALDADGDEELDYMVTSHPCRAGGGAEVPWCIDYWSRVGGVLELSSRYVAADCR